MSDTAKSQYDTKWQISHGEGLDDELQSFIESADTPSVESIVRFHKLRTEHTEQYQAIWRSIDDEDKRKILATVWQSRKYGVRYESLLDRLRCSERTVYRKLDELEENGIIERVGKPAYIKYTNQDIRTLAGDVLEAFYS